MSIFTGLLLFAANTATPPSPPVNLFTPNVNVSAVREIVCKVKGEYKGVGTGFLIGDKILATAKHVSDVGECKDRETDTVLTVYKTEANRDLVLMTGKNLPTDMPYIRISCEGYKTGQIYGSYGISGYGLKRTIIHSNFVTATATYTDEKFQVAGGGNWTGMRHLRGKGVPGMSGGFYTNLEGDAIGMVNVGARFLGLPLYDKYSYEFKGGLLCQPSLLKEQSPEQKHQGK